MGVSQLVQETQAGFQANISLVIGALIQIGLLPAEEGWNEVEESGVCGSVLNLFLKKLRMQSVRRKNRQMIITSPVRGASQAKREDCQKEWNRGVPCLYLLQKMCGVT